MKERNYLFFFILFHSLTEIIKSLTCPIGYVSLPYGTQQYCAKCDTTCLTCSNTGMNNCITCPTDFTFDSSTSYCLPPSTKQITTIESSYKFVGFTQITGWSGGSVTTNAAYAISVYTSTGGSITKAFAVTPSHYKIRILVSFWFCGSSSLSDTITVTFTNSGGTSLGTTTAGSIPLASQTTGGTYTIYPSDWRATNIDYSFNNYYDDSITATFTSTNSNFGLRQFVLVQYLCNSTACSRCTGSANTTCLSCTDTLQRVITALFPNQCWCDSSKGYYAYPGSDYCVNPCPNNLDGQYYGDPLTKQCVLTCSGSTYFSDPSTGLCATSCSASITLGSLARALYYDLRNKRCVTICPLTQPYFDAADRKCYSTCANGKFQNDLNMECVIDCSQTGSITYFGENGRCTEECVGSDNWGDFNTHLCTSTCQNYGGNQYFQDNSTLRNLCVRVCPYPDLYGDAITDPLQPYCHQVCPDNYYGDYLSPRHCVTKCSQDIVNDINYYGMKNSTRQCVPQCPNSTWSQTTKYTCVQSQGQCYIDNQKYADNNTWTCVVRGGCSMGRYTYLKTTQNMSSCVIDCPNGTYKDDATRHCELACTVVDYFADPGINYCVQICQTQDYYSDVSSSYKCVPSCNQAGLTPFRDFTTRKCVNICPIDRKLFADSILQDCVYNCTAGTYAYDNTGINPADTNKTCVSICPSPYFADNSTGTGKCILRCPQDPILFGDFWANNTRLCVAVCQTGKYGDQNPIGDRYCKTPCPVGWFAQNDALRRCVTRCNSTTYGYNQVCLVPASCTGYMVGDPSTNLCVDPCPITQGTYADLTVTKTCVSVCPIVGSLIYFADPTLRWCVSTCNASHLLFGNNKTQTCVTKCIDKDSYADFIHPNRFCNIQCTDDTINSVLYYRNNYTKTCVVSDDCPTNYFGDNSTDMCVAKCPIVNGGQTWGHISTKTCVSQCYGSLWGDASTGIPLCVSRCPTVPPKWSYNGNMTCMLVCPTSPALFGQDTDQTCVALCPNVTFATQTFAYTPTRRCLLKCPAFFYSDWKTGICYPTPQQCTFGWGDNYNNSCTTKCTGPTPWDQFGDSTTALCTIRCSSGLWADPFTGTRKCVPVCPGSYDTYGNVTGFDSFGENQTRRCVSKCTTLTTFADWQTHFCVSRCSGDIASTIPTYSNEQTQRCVIAHACPQIPDKLFGDNRTRKCGTTCFFSSTVTEWADNLTRTCIPQCYYINKTGGYAYQTRFYGDTSSGFPICIVICPKSPILFGQNITNICMPLCPNGTWGDQVNNRSCAAMCYEKDSVIYYSQDHYRICVSYCEDTTFANWHNRHCQTTPTGCIVSEYASDFNNSCVALCPESMNYFGDPTTKLCVKICPNISAPTHNYQTTLSQTPATGQTYGYFYADYKTRICVRTCPLNYGLQGTFGDNLTNTCVQRCPIGSYGDATSIYRHCVATCTNGNFADPFTMLCVKQCPASPPSFGYKGNWTCILSCPSGLWADSSTRTCVSDCPANTYRCSSNRLQCVSVCPSSPDLYGDSKSHNCQSTCTAGQYADPFYRTCNASCSPHFQYNLRCVLLCPKGYYANSQKNCILPASCDSPGLFAQNSTTKCVSTCTGGSFADPNSHYCIAVCPDGWYGENGVCVQQCQVSGNSISNISQMCMSRCSNLTYMQNNICVPKCTTLYANDVEGKCLNYCPSGPPRLFANPVNQDCDLSCSSGYVRDFDSGYCVTKANGCSDSLKFSDNVTGNCKLKCSNGYWGIRSNKSCQISCESGQYGYDYANQRTCYLPIFTPVPLVPPFLPPPPLYADPQTRQFIEVCQVTPKVYFADTILNLCSLTCITHDGTDYYGDPQTRKCQSSCQNYTFYTADKQQNRCVLKCTLGTFRWNHTVNPICKSICPEGYADPTTRVCVAICPVNAGTFGFYNSTSPNLQYICISTCPTGYYADSDPLLRTCRSSCDAPYYADNTTHQCVLYCTNSFADPGRHVCMDKCYPGLYPSADSSTNKCVSKCPSSPDLYNQLHVCVLYCTQNGFFADNSTRQCTDRCPNITGANPYFSYGDSTTGRCVDKCPEGLWGDNNTNFCVPTCPTGSFAQNLTRLCVLQCPVNQNLYADTKLHTCAYTCSGGFFGSKISQTCIQQCDSKPLAADNYWGDPLTTLCTKVCPSSIYSYGQNITRKCVASCAPHATYGFADNYTRICRDQCQNLTTPQTFADPTSSACVQRCPDGYFAQNTTNQCVQICKTGYADNFSRYCVAVCPDTPQSYGQINVFNNAKICVYKCMYGHFSNNDTNLCLPKCPTSPDFYGDINNDYRCVLFCTEGTYAQNATRLCKGTCPGDPLIAASWSFADNYTRRCVQICPTSTLYTYRDTTSWKCVRVCPVNFFAQNKTQMCVSTCPYYPLNNTQTYADNVSNYCVAQCPFPYYGRNDTHQCVLDCSPVARTLFGHNQGRFCVVKQDCYPVGSYKYYTDTVSGTCVQTCPQTSWADDYTYVCVNNCDPLGNLHQYRDMNTQKCVSICSSNPDEYADKSTGNCVSKCPDGSYAYANVNNNFRQCVPSCSPYFIYADNSTNRCVSTCPTLPFMYSDTNTYKCVYQCGDYNWFADNRTQKCVSQCPSSWQLWGDRLTHTCVELCPGNYYADPLDNRQCNLQCTSPNFADKYTSTCVIHCDLIRPYYYEYVSAGTRICVEDCPNSFGYNIDQTCQYQNADLSSSCPTTYFADRSTGQCVEQCPVYTFSNTITKYCEVSCFGTFYADQTTRSCIPICSGNFFALRVSPTNYTCVQYCPAPYYAQNSSHSCVQGCSSLLELQTTRTCESYCPQPYFAYNSQYKCVLNCTPIYADHTLRKCLPVCNSPAFANPLTMTCDVLCPNLYFGRTIGRICSKTCLLGTFADSSTRVCQLSCPSYPLTFADNILHECVVKCQTGFGYEFNRTCLASCPNATINLINVVYLADSSNNLCVLHCTNKLDSFADYKANKCTNLCPINTYANNFTKQCVPKCPTTPNYTFAHNTSRTCLDVCPINTFGSQDNLHCVADCWWPTFQDKTTHLCVQMCPEGYFGQNSTAICTQKCDPGTYADPTTRMCVHTCPIEHDLYKYDVDSICVSQCPKTFFADDTTRKCMKQCLQVNMYAYAVTDQCLRQCPVPFRAFDGNNTCIQECPYLYFYNVTRNKCTKCPNQCLVCTSPTTCLQCVGGYNLFNGMCGLSCIPTNGIITYSNAQGICVRTCPYLYYGDLSSYSCKSICPNKQYGSNTSQLCQNCPKTCASCLSLTECIVCQVSATLAIDKMCYADCNSTHKYYFNNTCRNICPTGTYLTYTNVYCGDCASTCATCNVAATNCTTCKGLYFYKSACLTQCPDNYYGDTNFVCKVCDDTVKACQKPLTFSTNVVVQNFKYNVYVKFNQGVDIQKQIQDLLKVSLKVQRRLLQTTNLINNGIKYTYEILADGQIKLTLIIDQSLASPQFMVSILDPTAIISKNNGGTLQNAQSDISLPSVEYYPPDEGTSAQTNMASRFTVVFILILYCITFLWSDAVLKPLQLLQLTLLHGSLDISIPASFYYYLLQFKSSIFLFLPNFFSAYTTSSNNYISCPQKIQDMFVDYNFLRSVGQVFFVAVVFAVLWALFFLLSQKRLIKHKFFFNFFQDVWNRRFKFMVVNDVLGLFYVPITWFALMQLNDLTNNGSSYMNANAALTIIFLILIVVMPTAWTMMWFKLDSIKFEQECSFMCKRIKPLSFNFQIHSEMQKISQQKLQQKQSQKLPSYENKSLKNSKYQLETVISYFYYLLMSIWLVGMYSNQIAQLSLLLVTNIGYLVYLCVQRPYVNTLNTLLTPLIPCILILIQSFMLYFQTNQNMFSSDKTSLSLSFLYGLSVLFMIIILWTIYRVIWQGIDTWKYFKKTEFYQVYGDNDHINEQQKSQTYSVYQRKAQKIQDQLGDIFVQKITKQVNLHGQSIVKVTKKVLKKKKKLLGRKKQLIIAKNTDQISNLNGSQHQQHEQLKVDQQQSQQEYIRVNRPNAFDWQKTLEKQRKSTQIKNSKQTNFRAIDDDIRSQQQNGQDESKQNYIIEQQMKTKQVKGQMNYKKKQTHLHLREVGESEISQIQQIQLVTKEQKVYQNNLIKIQEDDLPFEFISQMQQQKLVQLKNQEPQHQMNKKMHDISESASQIAYQAMQQSELNSQQLNQNQTDSKISQVVQVNASQQKVSQVLNKVNYQQLLLMQQKTKNKKLMMIFDDDEDQQE